MVPDVSYKLEVHIEFGSMTYDMWCNVLRELNTHEYVKTTCHYYIDTNVE